MGDFDAEGMQALDLLPPDLTQASQSFADVALVRGAAPAAVAVLIEVDVLTDPG